MNCVLGEGGSVVRGGGRRNGQSQSQSQQKATTTTTEANIGDMFVRRRSFISCLGLTLLLLLLRYFGARAAAYPALPCSPSVMHVHMDMSMCVCIAECACIVHDTTREGDSPLPPPLLLCSSYFFSVADLKLN